MIGFVTQEDVEEIVKYVNTIGEEVKKLREDFDQLVLEIRDSMGKKAPAEEEDDELEEEPEETPPKKVKKKKPKLRI